MIGAPQPVIAAASLRAEKARRDEIAKITRISNIPEPPSPPLTVFLKDCAADPRLYKTRLARLTGAITGLGDRRCHTIVREAAYWSGSKPVVEGLATVSWLLNANTKGRRLSAWILAIALAQGWRPSPPDLWTVTKA